jgi:branched-subunit amino acid aminotransferase/4-amino-4-deoxychorismate lyase
MRALLPALLLQVYSADEAFVTGTFAGLIPVKSGDGRVIGSGARGQLTAALQQAYMALQVWGLGLGPGGWRGPHACQG